MLYVHDDVELLEWALYDLRKIDDHIYVYNVNY